MEEITVIAEEESIQEIPVDGKSENTEPFGFSDDIDNTSSGESVESVLAPDSGGNTDLSQDPEIPESSELDAPVSTIDPVILNDILKTLNGINSDSKKYLKLYQETVKKQDTAIHNIQLISTVSNLGIFTVIGVLLALILAVFYSKYR